MKIRAVGVVALAAWAFLASVLYLSTRSRLVESERLAAQVNEKARDAESQLGVYLSRLDRETKQGNQLQKERDDIAKERDAVAKERDELDLAMRGKIELVHKGLRRFLPGENAVNIGTLGSFRIFGDELFVKLRNTTNKPLRPNVTICLIDHVGFTTSYVSFQWQFERIQPGENRNDSGSVGLSFGPPHWYTVSVADGE